jgi:hypothetical protein
MRTLTFLLVGAAMAIASIAAYEAAAQQRLAARSPGSYYFSDCSPTSPHDADIGYIYESAVANGFPDGTYGPQLQVSREQMASYINRSEAVAYCLTFMSVDWNFFGGYYTGATAYQEGRITLAQYQAATRAMEWATNTARAEFDQMRDTDIETIFNIYF